MTRPFTQAEFAALAGQMTAPDPALARLLATAAESFTERDRCANIAVQAAERCVATGDPVGERVARDIASRIRREGNDPVDMICVSSSNVHSIGYAEQEGRGAKGTLYVRFKSGGVWRYENVPPQVWMTMTMARSIGKFVATSVVPFYKGSKYVAEERPEPEKAEAE